MCIRDRYKHATITPIPKKDQLDYLNPSSYRPIAGLPFAGKLLERLVATRLAHHCESSKVFADSQSAYRTGRSVETAIISIVGTISSHLENKSNVVIIATDISAAFDTVNHEIMINKLQNIGVSGTALSWFASYLCDRTQSVTYGHTSSNRLCVAFTVPTWSSSGPHILFPWSRS